MSSLTSKSIAIVTGANSGCGYETVKALITTSKPKVQYHIYLGSRDLTKGENALERLRSEVTETEPWERHSVQILQVDLASDASIEAAYERVAKEAGRLDTLVNNAGLTMDLEYVHGAIGLRDCFMQSYNVNVAGTNVLTHTFMPLLLKSRDPRLLFVSGLSHINQAAEKYFPTPPQPAGWPKKIAFETIGYRCSKVALNMLMLDWNHKLQADGVKVWAVGPGMLLTNLGRGRSDPEKLKAMGAVHASAGGDMLRRVVEGERDADVGKAVLKDGQIHKF